MSFEFQRHEPCCQLYEPADEGSHTCLYCVEQWPCPTEQTKRQVVMKVLEIVGHGDSLVSRSIAEEIKEL